MLDRVFSNLDIYQQLGRFVKGPFRFFLFLFLFFLLVVHISLVHLAYNESEEGMCKKLSIRFIVFIFFVYHIEQTPGYFPIQLKHHERQTQSQSPP